MSKQQIFRLQELLKSWGLPQLFESFRDEGIFLEELEMMKNHHIDALFQNHRMGIRIRFEHYFEKWRRSINKPLSLESSNGPFSINTQKFITTTNSPYQVPQVITELNPTPDPKSGSIIPINPLEIPNTNHDFTAADWLSSSTASELPSQTSTQTKFPIVLQPLASNHAVIKDGTSNRRHVIHKSALQPSKVHTQEALADSGVTVLKILQESGKRGKALLDYYKEHQSLSKNHRQLLVRLIITFFEDNNYHLSLNTSYILEKQILELFPNEKLDYYRGDKPVGKIYYGYSNLKRRGSDFFATRKRAKIMKTKGLGETSDHDCDFDGDDFAEANDDFLSYDDTNDNDVKVEIPSD